MPGMNSGLNAADPTVVAAFRAALLHQGLIALAIFAVLSIVWVSVRDRTENAANPAPQTAHPEPAGHQLLRIGFGLLWVFDGLLIPMALLAAGGFLALTRVPAAVTAPAADLAADPATEPAADRAGSAGLWGGPCGQPRSGRRRRSRRSA